MSQLHKKSFSITFGEGKMVIRQQNISTVATEKLIGKSYELELNVDEVFKTSREIHILARAAKNGNIELYHICLKHLNHDVSTQLLNKTYLVSHSLIDQKNIYAFCASKKKWSEHS